MRSRFMPAVNPFSRLRTHGGAGQLAGAAVKAPQVPHAGPRVAHSGV
eukprot:COSAG04_NODE_4151_length_2268_cov_1.899032_1_plen_46_part_10